MSDDAIPARLANLDTKWNWISEAPSRVDALTSALSSLTSRVDAIEYDEVNGKIVNVAQGNENGLPGLADQLSKAQQALDSESTAFDNTMADLTTRVAAIQAQVG